MLHTPSSPQATPKELDAVTEMCVNMMGPQKQCVTYILSTGGRELKEGGSLGKVIVISWVK